MFVKIKYAEKNLVIRIKYESQTLADLAEKMREKCQVEGNHQMYFTYIDAEGDKITLDSTDDLENAVEDVKIHQKDKNPVTLTLDVHTAPASTLVSNFSVVQDALIGHKAEIAHQDESAKEAIENHNISDSFFNPQLNVHEAPENQMDETRDRLNQFRRIGDESTLTSIQPLLENPAVINVANTGNFPGESLPQPSGPSFEYPEDAHPVGFGTLDMHLGTSCSQCFVAPIEGTRWRIVAKNDFDLCDRCVIKPEYKDLVMIRIPRYDPKVRSFDNQNFEAIVRYFEKNGSNTPAEMMIEEKSEPTEVLQASQKPKVHDTRSIILKQTMCHLLPNESPQKIEAFLQEFTKDPLSKVNVDTLVNIFLADQHIRKNQPPTFAPPPPMHHQAPPMRPGLWNQPYPHHPGMPPMCPPPFNFGTGPFGGAFGVGFGVSSLAPRPPGSYPTPPPMQPAFPQRYR